MEVSRFLLPLAHEKSDMGDSFVYRVGGCPEVRGDDDDDDTLHFSSSIFACVCRQHFNCFFSSRGSNNHK